MRETLRLGGDSVALGLCGGGELGAKMEVDAGEAEKEGELQCLRTGADAGLGGDMGWIAWSERFETTVRQR
jgi:hypothetical protein